VSARWHAWLRDIGALVRRRGADGDVEAELLLHVEMQANRHVEAGMSPAAARRRALVEFGGLERYREQTMDARLGRILDDLLRDAIQGTRSLRRNPAYAIGTVLLLAVGVGVGTATFAVSHGVLVRELPYTDPDRLYNLFEAKRAGGIRTTSYPAFGDWTDQLTAFESIAYIRGEEFRARGRDGTQRLLAGYVSPGFFEMFGTAPRVGRTLRVEDGAAAIVLSDHVWRRSFGADRAVVGRSFQAVDGSFTIVGVMPAGFRIPSYADVWLLLDALPPDARYALTQRDLHVDAEAWGRIRQDVTPAQAEADLSRVVGALAQAYPGEGEWTQGRIIDMRTSVIGGAADQLRLLGSAVLLLVILTCVNVAGLQLARNSVRTREMAVRAALGAGHGRLTRQLLTESLVLASLGGIAGTVLAWYIVEALTRNLPDVLPRLPEIGVGAGAFVVALALSSFTAVVAGVLPAWRATRPRVTGMLRTGPATAGSADGARLRAVLVSVQVALALVLGTSSALLLRSLAALQDQDPGFSTDRVVLLRVFPPARYSDADAARTLYAQLQESVRRVPGVQNVALANHVPFGGGWMVTRLGTGGPAPEAGDNVLIRTVSPDYFDVMRLTALTGRLLSEADEAIGSGVLINDAAARQFYGEADPVGQLVTIFHSAQGRENFGEPIHAPIVGVVRSERFFGFERPAPPAVFVPWTWMVWPNITLVARAAGDVPTAQLRSDVRSVEPDIPVAGPAHQAEWRELDAYVGRSLRPRTLTAALFTGFGALALGLALTGIFATTAYLVARRQRELAIRSAIGASPATILRLVLTYALRLALIGVVIGIPAALAAGVLLRAQLFGVGPGDPTTFVLVTFAFLAAAGAAATLPALRAAAIEPAISLRSD
jgi:predicted permease